MQWQEKWSSRGTVLVLIAAAAATILWSEKAESQQTEDVRYVMNTARPQKPDMVVEVKEILRIGETEKGEEYTFAGITGLVVDETGRIYVLLPQDDIVRVFNPDGEYSHDIGRQGMGPGELKNVAGINLGPEGNIWISSTDTQRLSIFRRDGSYLRDIRFPRLPPFFIQTTSSGFYGLQVDQRLSEDRSLMMLTFSLQRFSADGDLLNTLFTISDELDYNRLRLGGTSDKYPYYTLDNQGRIWQTRRRTDLYEINVYKPDGSLECVVRKEFAPIRKSEEEIEEEREIRRRMLARRLGDALPPGMTVDVDIDPLRPATGLPYFDPRGYTWIQVNRHGVSESNAFDIFDVDGQFLKRVVFDNLKYPALLTFRADMLYLAEVHPQEEPQIIIFSITVVE